MALGDIVDMHEVQAGIDEGRHPPVAASTMMRPVGVGLTSRGPIGVDGLTIMAGSLSRAIICSTSRSATTLLRL